MNYLGANTVVSQPGGSIGSDFLRITDKKPGEDISGDGMSPAETAATLGDIFAEFVPASQSDIISQDALSDFIKNKYSGTDGLQLLAEDVGVDDLCPSTLAPTGKKTLPVYVHASSNEIFENYDLVAYGSAKSGPTIMEDTVDKTVEFSSVSFINIGYNLRSDKYRLKFIGVTDQDGKSIGGDPVYSISADGIHLHGTYSGTVKITGLQIMYHVWDITLTGIALDDGKRLYSGRVSVISTAYKLGPYHQKIGGEVTDDAAAQCPFGEHGFAVGDPDRSPQCFIQVQNEIRGTCSGQLLEPIFFTYNSVPCPDGVIPTWNNPYTYKYNPELPEYYKILEYVTSPSYRYDGASAALTDEEYEEICCHPPAMESCIPQCRNKKSTFYAVEIRGGRQKYIDEYDGKTVFVPVGTKAGPCGTLTDTFVDPANICCEDTDPIVIRPATIPDTIDIGSYIDIVFDGGKSPFTVTITGSNEFSFSGGSVIHKTAVYIRVVRIFAFDVCSQSAQLKIEDRCYNSDTAQLNGPSQNPCQMFNVVPGPPDWTVAEALEFATPEEAELYIDGLGSLIDERGSFFPGGSCGPCVANPEYYIAVGNDRSEKEHYYGYVCMNTCAE